MDSSRFRNNGNNSHGGRGIYRRYSRSRSKSRECGREQNYRNKRKNSRSRSRDRGGYKMDNNNDNNLCHSIINQDLIDDNRKSNGNNSQNGVNNNPNNKFRSCVQDDDYMDERYYNGKMSKRERDRDQERDYDNRDRTDRDRTDGGDHGDNKSYGGPDGNNSNHNNRRYDNVDNDHYDADSDESDENSLDYYGSTNRSESPSDTITVLGLQSHITKANIMSLLIQAQITPADIRLIRNRSTGASRGYAFVEFNTTEEAVQWMEYTQGTLKLNDSCHATLQYNHLKDWDCSKCGFLNFKRRDNCLKCCASRDDSEYTGMDDNLKGKPTGSNGNAWYCNKGTFKDSCHATLQYSLLKNWDCSNCGFFNFKRRANCLKCCTSRDDSEFTYADDDLKAKPKGSNGNAWHCDKCGGFNFKHRDSCFKCFTTRGDGSYGGETGEISNILSKKIMLRNLDGLTNEESVLTTITQHAPELANKITKVFVLRETLTQTSRGICFLNFECLVDSMKMHNLLSTLEPPLKIDEKEVLVSYCVDNENIEIVPKKKKEASAGENSSPKPAATTPIGPMTAEEAVAAASAASLNSGPLADQYTLYDVRRLAEYSASLYATTPAEHAHYLQYYTEYYIAEMSGRFLGNIPTGSQSIEANLWPAGALSAIKRKQAKVNSSESTSTAAATAAAAPKGNDGKVYPAPDVSLYQYDETSGYYYDPTTGLYYDAHSQYYYNNETGAYLYWDQRKSTYVLAAPATVKAAVKQDSETTTSNSPEEETTKKEKKDCDGGVNKHDKVKVAKKIVKDMEKWAKQLNQKKDYIPVAAPQSILAPGRPEELRPSTALSGASGISSGYADVCFSILEKKVTNKLSATYMSPMTLSATNKVTPTCGSDSEDDAPPSPKKTVVGVSEASEKDYVDFQKLTCLLCKRAFQSLEILQKHLIMSILHKENLAKHNLARGALSKDELTPQTEFDQETALATALSYRDRAKERRLKYGDSDVPAPNPDRELFEKEIKHLSSRSAEAPVMPIGSNNVGNRLLQKMGWSEGQGLGRKNQGRTNIIEANARSSTTGLGTKGGGRIGPAYDYKTYIKKMMKSRYESL